MATDGNERLDRHYQGESGPMLRIAKLEAQVDTLLNALAQMIRLHTGQTPVVSEIRRKFLETGELPYLK